MLRSTNTNYGQRLGIPERPTPKPQAGNPESLFKVVAPKHRSAEALAASGGQLHALRRIEALAGSGDERQSV